MRSAWQSCTIKDLLDCGEAELRTGPYGFLLHADEASKVGVPMLHVRNIGFGDIREEKLEFVPQEVASRLADHLLQEGDIVFGRKSAIDRHAFVTSQQANWLQGSDCIRLRLKSPSIDPKFLSYYFLTDRHKQWTIDQCSHSETMDSLNHAIIGRIPLSFPPLQVQQEIVDLLSDYDELIEVSSKQFNLLDEIARSLYQEWFVQRPKSASMVESELKSIPSGWKVEKLSAIADINKVSLKKQNAPGIIRYVDISSVSTGRIDKIETIAFSQSSSRARRVVKRGDIIWSTVRPSRQIYALVSAQELVVSTGFVAIAPRGIPSTYLYCALTTKEFVEYLVRSATGSAYPAVPVDRFKDAPILVPPSDLLEEWSDVAEDIFAQKDCIHEKIQNLCRSRNLLLHRLLQD